LRSSSKRRVSLTTLLPAAMSLDCRPASNLRALSRFRRPCTFLTSTLSSPTEMLASTRTVCSSWASSPQRARSSITSWSMNVLASSGEVRSGAVTISTSGMPERL